MLITRAQKASDPLKELLFESTPIRPNKLRAQKRKKKFWGSARSQDVQQMKSSTFLDFDITPDISVLQKADPIDVMYS